MKGAIYSVFDSPIVVINVIENRNADEYDHLCGLTLGWAPVCWIFDARTARNNVSCGQKTREKKNRLENKWMRLHRMYIKYKYIYRLEAEDSM